MSQVLEKAAKLLSSGNTGVLATVVYGEGSSPRKLGAKMVITDNGSIVGTIGGGSLEHHIMNLVSDVLAEGQPRLIKSDLDKDLGMACGGGVWVLMEPLVPRDRLVILGGGHIAQKICAMAVGLDLQVWVLDGRPEFVNLKRFPSAQKRVERLDPNTLLKDLDLDTDTDKGADFLAQHTYVVVVSHDHGLDARLVEKLLHVDSLKYLGMVGSQTKRSATKKHLRKSGFSDEVIENRLQSPVGLPLGGRNPTAIALSILSEIQATRNKTWKNLEAVAKTMATKQNTK